MKIDETRNSLRIQKARTALLLDHPFFGSLLYRLKDRESRAVKTMATDGISLLWNPEFVETLNAATLAGTLAHEVMHPALHHHLRRSGRDPKRWNITCDYALNPLLVDAGRCQTGDDGCPAGGQGAGGTRSGDGRSGGGDSQLAGASAPPVVGDDRV